MSKDKLLFDAMKALNYLYLQSRIIKFKTEKERIDYEKSMHVVNDFLRSYHVEKVKQSKVRKENERRNKEVYRQPQNITKDEEKT